MYKIVYVLQYPRIVYRNKSAVVQNFHVGTIDICIKQLEKVHE